MRYLSVALILLVLPRGVSAQNRHQPELFEVPPIRSSWDDLTDGIKTKDEWQKRRAVLKQRYLDLLRDEHKRIGLKLYRILPTVSNWKSPLTQGRGLKSAVSVFDCWH